MQNYIDCIKASAIRYATDNIVYFNPTSINSINTANNVDDVFRVIARNVDPQAVFNIADRVLMYKAGYSRAKTLGAVVYGDYDIIINNDDSITYV